MKKLCLTKKIMLGLTLAVISVLAAGTGVWAYTSPYTYVSLDVNPSVEYTLNRFERVIDVKAVNDDGQVILDKINIDGLTNQSIEDAILNTVNQISKDGYFTGTAGAVTGSAIEVNDSTDTADEVTDSVKTIDGGIIITIANDNNAISEELANQLKTAVVNFVNDNVVVEVTSVGYDRVQEARKLGVTPGKLNLVEKLKASSDNPDSIVLEDWLNKPVKDIMKAIKVNRKENLEDTDDTDSEDIEETNETADSTAEVSETTEDTQESSIEDSEDTDEVSADAKITKELEKQQKFDAKDKAKALKKENKVLEKENKAIEKENKKLEKENRSISKASKVKKSEDTEEVKEDTIDQDIEENTKEDTDNKQEKNEEKSKKIKSEKTRLNETYSEDTQDVNLEDMDEEEDSEVKEESDSEKSNNKESFNNGNSSKSEHDNGKGKKD